MSTAGSGDARAAGLLVTGLPRSGTSWVGKMLEASGEVVYVNEPLNPRHPPGHSPGVLDADVTHQFQYIAPDDDAEWRRAFGDTLRLRYHLLRELRRNHRPYDLGRCAKYATAFTTGRLRHRRALLDDPYALFSTGWLVQTMGVRAVVLVRDPVAFVGSWRSLDWTIDFEELVGQPLLLRDHLGPYVERMRALVGSPDWLARSALLWEAAYDVVDRAFRELPGVSLVSYESLVQQPVARFAELYATLGLTWGEAAERRIREATTERPGAERGAMRWSGFSRTAFRPMGRATALSTYRERLTAEEIERVRELTAAVAARVLPRHTGGPSAGVERTTPEASRDSA